MIFIVATNVIASQPLKRQPTGMPTARSYPLSPKLVQSTLKHYPQAHLQITELPTPTLPDQF